MQELIKNIENWAEERNLINGSTPQKQFIKLMEKFGELCAGISKNNIDMIKDSIGDCVVVLVIMNKQAGGKLFPDGLQGVFYDISKEDFSKKIEMGINISSKEILVSNIVQASAQGLGEMGEMLFSDEYEDITGILTCFYAFSEIYKLSFENCVRSAWEEIKDRKGKMINGVFVKEADLGAKND